jgi:hypothetical protein
MLRTPQIYPERDKTQEEIQGNLKETHTAEFEENKRKRFASDRLFSLPTITDLQQW